jgi:hypothetical protein
MIPLTRYSTAFASVLEDEADPLRIPPDVLVEDSPERVLRKLMHMVRNRSFEKRTFSVMLPARSVKAGTVMVQGKALTGVTAEILAGEPDANYAYDINPAIRRDSDYQSPFPPVLLLSFGVTFDNKIRLGFRSADDKLTFLNYVDRIPLQDDFVPSFKNLDQAVIGPQITVRTNTPEVISQGGSPLCGPAVVAYIMAKHFKEQYRSAVLDLFNYAEAFVGPNHFLVKPRVGAPYLKKADDLDRMPQADFVLLASLRASANSVLSYDGANGLGGVSWPSEIENWLERMLGVRAAMDKSKIMDAPMDELVMLEEMTLDLEAGYECLMHINAAMIAGDFPWPTRRHWVVLKQVLPPTLGPDNVKLSFFTWGYTGSLAEKEMTKAHFASNFFGYIKCKVR